MRRLLLLLPLVVVAARMQIEWLWFDQFAWSEVLLKRWLLQLLFAGLSMLPLLAALTTAAGHGVREGRGGACGLSPFAGQLPTLYHSLS